MQFHIPTLRRQKKEKEPNPLRLPQLPAPVSARERELGTAKEILGVKTKPDYAYAYLEPYGNASRNGNEARVPVYHEMPVPLEQILWYMDQVTFVVLSEPANLEPVMSSLNKAKEGQNRAYQNHIDSTMDWVVPNYDPHYDGKQLHGHSVVYWGRVSAIYPDGNEETGSLHGTIPSNKQVGSVIRSVVERLPVDFTEQRVDPMLVAAPSEPQWEDDHYVIGKKRTGYRAFAFWKGILNLQWIPGLLQLDVDILLNVETEKTSETDAHGNPMKETYITVILRSSGEIDENGRCPKLESLDRQLRYLGNWRRVRGSDIRVAFQAFVPGSSPLPEGFRWYRRSVRRARTLTKTLVATVGTVGRAVHGDRMIGYKVEMIEVEPGKYEPGRKLYPVLIPKEMMVAVAIVGPSGAGKTTLAAEYALEENPNTLVAQLSTAQGEGTMTWGYDFGGRVLKKKLPDAVHENDKERERIQRQLMQDDIKDAENEVARLAKLWHDSGLAIGLPLILRPEITSLRYYNWVRAFLKAFTAAWEQWNVTEVEILGEDGVTRKVARYKSSARIVIDDFSKWPGKATSLQYGNIPAEIGAEAHALMQEAVGDFRKKGLGVYFTTHAKDNFKVHSDGFLESCTLLVEIDLNEKTRRKIANFYNPAKDPPYLIVGNVEVTLDPALLNNLSRLEDRR